MLPALILPVYVGNNDVTFEYTLAFVKYKLPAVSITFAVYRLIQPLAVMLPALILPAANC